MITIQEALFKARTQLASITDVPHLEAEVLLSYVLSVSRTYLVAFPEEMLCEEKYQQFVFYIEKRCNKEPLAYITGQREFWSLPLLVTRDTLIPRPETEVLVEHVLSLLGEGGGHTKVADLGTGSGAIALAISHERPVWQVCATDISEKALCVAKKNAYALSLNQIAFYQGDWVQALPQEHFDAIVSNPPYIAEVEWPQLSEDLAFEPERAFIAGRDGLEAILSIAATAKNYLKEGGYLVLEHGFSQGPAVREIFSHAGYIDIYSIFDLSSCERATIGRYQG